MFHLRFAARQTRRTVAVTALVGALALSACSASDTPTDGGSADTGTGTAGDTWTYESEFGPVELPHDIERIVSVDFYTPGALLDVGVTPVGVVETYFADTEGGGIPTVYTDAIRASDAISIGEYYEMNLEAIAQAQPDLILATSDFLPLDSPMRAEMEKLAPIVTFSAREIDSWKIRAEAIATILDKEEELAPLIDEYETRRDELKVKYADILENNTFVVFSGFEDEWGTFAETHFSTPVLRDLGTTFREQADDEINPQGYPNWFSYEELGRISNADIMLLPTTSADDILARMADNTIWQNLPAVQNDMVFTYIDREPTGAYGWAMDNLESLDVMFGNIQAKVAAE